MKSRKEIIESLEIEKSKNTKKSLLSGTVGTIIGTTVFVAGGAAGALPLYIIGASVAGLSLAGSAIYKSMADSNDSNKAITELTESIPLESEESVYDHNEILKEKNASLVKSVKRLAAENKELLKRGDHFFSLYQDAQTANRLDGIPMILSSIDDDEDKESHIEATERDNLTLINELRLRNDVLEENNHILQSQVSLLTDKVDKLTQILGSIVEQRNSQQNAQQENVYGINGFSII